MSKMTNLDWMFAEFRATGYYESEDYRNEDPPEDPEEAAEGEWWVATEPPDAVDEDLTEESESD